MTEETGFAPEDGTKLGDLVAELAAAESSCVCGSPGEDRTEGEEPQRPVMRTGRTLSQESPVTGGLVTLYRVTAGDGPDVCVGAVPAAEADMIVRAVNEYFARYDGERVPVLRQALWDCYGAAGGDQDGDQACPPAGAMAPDVHVLAVEAVRELRRDYGEDEPLVRADERSRIALLAQEYGATYPTCPCQPERGIGDQSHIGGSPAPFADLIRGDQP